MMGEDGAANEPGWALTQADEGIAKYQDDG